MGHQACFHGNEQGVLICLRRWVARRILLCYFCLKMFPAGLFLPVTMYSNTLSVYMSPMKEVLVVQSESTFKFIRDLICLLSYFLSYI